MPCTTILVGKKATFDGSTFVARNEDSPSGEFRSKKFIVLHPKDQPKTYKSVLSKVEIPMMENPMRCTLMPDGTDEMGVWGACGVNELNISMSATETLTSNERVLSADPLVVYQKAVGKEGEEGYIPEKAGGIGEEDMVSLVLPFMKSAREGVQILGDLLEKYGTYEMNGIAFQDEDEIWWLETIGGHHWIARRVPDDSYVIMPNQLGLDYFDIEDAMNDQEEYMCSKDLKKFIDDNHLDLSLDGRLNPRDAFGSRSDSDHVYNTPRAWILQRYFNPTTSKWDGPNADYRPESDNIPWSRMPERKITPEDIKYALSNHYQSTPFDPYGKGTTAEKGSYRPIGISRNNFLGFVQIRPYVKEQIKSIEWLALSSNTFNAMIPFYTYVDDTPAYLRDSADKVTTEDFYWTNRIIAALTDAHFNTCNIHVERYQGKVQSKTLGIIKEYDEKIKDIEDDKEIKKLCEEANQKIADETKKLTDELLSKVLFTASCQMKNGFARSDN